MTDFWSSDTSVLFTSYWGWSPDTWGTIGWTGKLGLSRRTALLRELTNPFIAVVYVTKAIGEENLRGKIAGFYLVSHEVGHRDQFTHHTYHGWEAEKWEHSLRAIRAFSYVPEYRLDAADIFPGLAIRALPVSRWCELVTDAQTIETLRTTPWVETHVYTPVTQETESVEDFQGLRGFTRAGPENRNGYVVSSSAQSLGRQLYVLELSGNTDVFLNRLAGGKKIYKIGLSSSPELRRQSLQSALPEGSFRWKLARRSLHESGSGVYSFEAAVAGEYAMKESLAQSSDWLGGEFYLASQAEITAAWELGNAAANAFKKT